MMPAVVLVLACCLGGLQLATQQLRLQDAASGAARSAARGESAAVVAERVAQLVSRASVGQSSRGGLVCVELSLPASIGNVGIAITLRARSCALAGGL